MAITDERQFPTRYILTEEELKQMVVSPTLRMYLQTRLCDAIDALCEARMDLNDPQGFIKQHSYQVAIRDFCVELLSLQG